MNITPDVTIYTDGACVGNPGRGGYGVVLISGPHRRELSGGYRLTTNNRMEIMGAIVGLSALKTRCRVTLYSDSKYLVDTMSQGRALMWERNKWRLKSTGQRAKNVDLWKQLLHLGCQHDVSYIWVKGHSGVPENEVCDHLANKAAEGELMVDMGYEPIKEGEV